MNNRYVNIEYTLISPPIVFSGLFHFYGQVYYLEGRQFESFHPCMKLTLPLFVKRVFDKNCKK